jgi:hypothetical protein
MLKAMGKIDGRDCLVLGLSFGNLDRFRAEPCETFIKIDGRELGLPHDVMIISGETEAHMAAMMNIGRDTKVTITDRLKQ